MKLNELTFTNAEESIKDVIIEPLCYHIAIKKGETYIYKTKETDLIFEYTDSQITITQNHELGFAVYKLCNNIEELEFDMLDTDRIG